MEISIETSKIKKSWPLMEPASLGAVRIRMADIKEIEPAFFSIPGHVYEEQRVASPTHPCAGSIGVFLEGKDGIRRSIEEIFFYDYNLSKNHFKGQPHWNHERRFNDGTTTWTEKNVVFHQIPASPWIRISLKDSNGSVLKEKTVKLV